MIATMNLKCESDGESIALQCVCQEGTVSDSPLLRLNLSNLEGNTPAREFFTDGSEYRMTISKV